MSKKSRFRAPFDKHQIKHSQALLKYESQHLYDIHGSLPSQLSGKKSVVLTCQILGLLVNTFAADEMYIVLPRDNLRIPMNMILSHK